MSPRTKYPRTSHLPWSPGASTDDLRMVDVAFFEGVDVVVTEKMDGENTTMYRDGLHARSLDSRHHPSRDWVKRLQAELGYQIPERWRLCGENLYARHSIAYTGLQGYFYLFSIWDETNTCLSWDDTREWAHLLNLPTPPELYRGMWDAAHIEALTIDPSTTEGYVVRRAEAFPFDAFGTSVAKWVRPHHVQTDQHWMYAPIIPNELAGE